MNSSPSSASALKQMEIAAAAPPTINRLAPVKSVPNRLLISLASVSRTSGLPAATV